VPDGVLAGKWKQNKFMYEEFPIPAGMLKPKTQVSVRFQPEKDNMVARIFYIRLVVNSKI